MPDRHGPTRIGRFTVEVDGVLVQGPRRVELPSRTTEQGQYREGDDPDHEKKLLGQTTFGTLTIERTVPADDRDFFDWAEEVRMGDEDGARKELAITAQDGEGADLITWEFQNAWIRHYDPPTLDVDDDQDLVDETAVFSFDKMVRQYADGG